MINSGKFKGYLIASDIDGTLTDSNGNISKENADAIKYFQSEGGLFTVASGRFPDFIDKFKSSFIPNTYIIGINGTVLYDPQNKCDLIQHVLDDRFDNVIIDAVESNLEIENIVIARRCGDKNIIRKDFPKLREILSNTEKPWYKTIFCQNSCNTPIVKERLVKKYSKKYNIDCSWSEGIEFHSIGSGKGEMIGDLIKILSGKGYIVRKSVCVGDYENDISMIKYADIGYAVENATDIVKKSADRITVSNNKSVIYHIINDLEKDL